jgi:hypothetical protein
MGGELRTACRDAMIRLFWAACLLTVVGTVVAARQVAPDGPQVASPAPIDAGRIGAIQKQLESIAQDLDSVKGDVQTIRDYTKPQIIDFRQMVGDQISNLIWEVIGYKKTEKTIVGKAITLGGALVTLLSIITKFTSKNKQVPKPLLYMFCGYAGFAMVALAVTAFTSTAPTAQPTVALDTSALERRLDGIDRQLANVQASSPNVAAASNIVVTLGGLQRASSQLSADIKQLDARVAGVSSSSGGFQTFLLVVAVGLLGAITWKAFR